MHSIFMRFLFYLFVNLYTTLFTVTQLICWCNISAVPKTLTSRARDWNFAVFWNNLNEHGFGRLLKVWSLWHDWDDSVGRSFEECASEECGWWINKHRHGSCRRHLLCPLQTWCLPVFGRQPRCPASFLLLSLLIWTMSDCLYTLTLYALLACQDCTLCGCDKPGTRFAKSPRKNPKFNVRFFPNKILSLT